MNRSFKKTYRITNPIRFFAFVFIFVFGVTFAGIAIFDFNSNNVSASSARYETVKITDGDTLWNIIETYNGSSVDLRQAVDELCNINDIRAGDVKPGDIIKVPIYDVE